MECVQAPGSGETTGVGPKHKDTEWWKAHLGRTDRRLDGTSKLGELRSHITKEAEEEDDAARKIRYLRKRESI